ncbi:hypothetical protein D3C77_524110 [compost metagenome]
MLELFETFHFNFHRLAGGDLVGGIDRLGDATAGSDVVFLDQEGIEQTDAMVVTAAASDGVLLCQAQARQGLAGVEQFDLGIGDFVRKKLCMRGHARKHLQEVQGATLAAQQ